jgi:hypothetical protein
MKYICKKDFYIHDTLVGKEGHILEFYDARANHGEDAEDLDGYCDIFNHTNGAAYNAIWDDIDESVLQQPEAPIISYYECEFDKLDPKSGDQAMCIKGERIPTVEEANVFLAKDIEEWYHAPVVAVFPLSKGSARAFYECSNEDEWPIFR